MSYAKVNWLNILRSKTRVELRKYLQKPKATHSSIDSSDGLQETITGSRKILVIPPAP